MTNYTFKDKQHMAELLQFLLISTRQDYLRFTHELGKKYNDFNSIPFEAWLFSYGKNAVISIKELLLLYKELFSNDSFYAKTINEVNHVLTAEHYADLINDLTIHLDVLCNSILRDSRRVDAYIITIHPSVLKQKGVL